MITSTPWVKSKQRDLKDERGKKKIGAESDKVILRTNV